MAAKTKYLLAHGLSFIASVILTLVLAKYFAVAEFGRYGVWVAVLNFLIPVITFGMTPYIIKIIKSGQSREFDFYRSVKALFGCGLILGAALLSVVNILVPELNGGFKAAGYFYWMAVALAILVLISAYSRAIESPNLYLLNVGGQKVAHVLVLYILIVIVGDITSEHYFISGAISASIIGLILYIAYNKAKNKEGKNVSLGGSRIPQSIAFCVPVIVLNAVTLALPLVERAILVGWIDPEELGKYVFNYEITAKFLAVMLLFMKIIVFPSVMAARKQDEVKKYNDFLKKTIAVLMVALIAVVAIGFAVYEPAMRLAALDGYINPYLFMLAGCYSAMVVLGYMINIGIMITGKTRVMAYGAGLMLVSHVAGLYMVVPAYGAYGAATSLLFSQLLSITLMYFVAGKELKKYVKEASGSLQKSPIDF